MEVKHHKNLRIYASFTHSFVLQDSQHENKNFQSGRNNNLIGAVATYAAAVLGGRGVRRGAAEVHVRPVLRRHVCHLDRRLVTRGAAPEVNWCACVRMCDSDSHLSRRSHPEQLESPTTL